MCEGSFTIIHSCKDKNKHHLGEYTLRVGEVDSLETMQKQLGGVKDNNATIVSTEVAFSKCMIGCMDLYIRK